MWIYVYIYVCMCVCVQKGTVAIVTNGKSWVYKFLLIESINKYLKQENDENKEYMSQIVEQKATLRDKQL